MMPLSFMDDGTILAQSKQLDDNNVGLWKAYKIIYLLFVAFALILEHDKTKLFHFSHRCDAYNPSLDLGYAPHTGNTPLKPKTYWRYLGFYFDCRLTFHEHVRYYATKAFTTVQAMRMLRNSTRGLLPKQRRLLYRSCVVPIATYGYRLWYFHGACNKGTMNQLKQMQQKVALWITGAFRTSPTGGLEALAGLIPIHLVLKKLATHAVYHVATLSDTHLLRSMLGERLLKWAEPHACSATLMTPTMWGRVKSTVMEVDEYVHALTESFKPFVPEAHPGDQLLDCFVDRLHFDECNPTQDRRPYLDKLIAITRADPLVLAATDGSVPQSNQYQAALAAIIYKEHRELERTHYVSGRVTAPDAELNAIACAVHLAVKQANCQHIMVFTDSMGSAHRAVDPFACIHTLTESFEPFVPEARPGDHLLDRYVNRLHFDKRDPAQDRRPYLHKLIVNGADPLTVLAATDGSVPQSNQYHVASAAIIYKGHCKLERTHYVSGRVTAPDAELNAISCAVCLAVKQANCQHIMVFTDSMGSAHRAVDPSIHTGQAFSLSVCHALQEWFEADNLHHITFVYIPSALRWDIHGEAHKYITKLKVRIGHRKMDNSIDTLRSRATHSVLDLWSSTFQDPTYRGSEFLELQWPDGQLIQPSYLNGGPWLSTFGHSITEFAHVCWSITGHTPIGVYYHRFKINEPHSCTCGAALQDIASFLKHNPTAFGFNRDPLGVG
ncbi:unnamed protein product [Cyclocybe aegerita]|uniref:RNase H type-1 domain-containing protein n=1 Tax=Cyclocybe aegerita TaxID=1973307 RepID=A0A8S0XZV4_CYCAE|nr:unnamed protein product [Cyclocybe aegerita]